MNRIPRPGRLCGIWVLVALSGFLFELGYFRWWPAILVTPLPLAYAFAQCRSLRGSLLLGLFGGFLVLRIHQDALTVYNHSATNFLVFINALTLVPVALVVYLGARLRYRMTWVLPIAWVGAEAMRLAGSIGLPFAVLGFACHEERWMIQIADLGGPLLLSFAIAALNGCLLDFLLAEGPLRKRLRVGFLPGGLVVGLGWAAIFVYGQVRLRQTEEAIEPGPRIAVLQTDGIKFQNPEMDYDGEVLLKELMDLSEQAASTLDPPDLIVWPERTSNLPLYNRGFLQTKFDPRMLPKSSQAATDLSPFEAQWEEFLKTPAAHYAHFVRWLDALGIPVLAGLSDQRVSPSGRNGYFEHRNAASLFFPGDSDSSQSQFKMRLFPGAETIPGGPEAWLGILGWLPPARRWLESVANLEVGEERVLMRVDAHPFVVSICSEILHSDSSGVLLPETGDRHPIIVSIASEAILQRNHSILVCKMAMAFRAVEARTTVARSNNGGISGFVDPTGRYYGMVRNADGSYFTRMGAPEAEAIQAVIEFRHQYGDAAIQADPELRETHRRLIEKVEQLRRIAGVSGFSVQNTFTTSLRTPYQSGGYHFPSAVIATCGLLLVFLCLRFCSAQEGLKTNPGSHVEIPSNLSAS